MSIYTLLGVICVAQLVLATTADPNEHKNPSIGDKLLEESQAQTRPFVRPAMNPNQFVFSAGPFQNPKLNDGESFKKMKEDDSEDLSVTSETQDSVKAPEQFVYSVGPFARAKLDDLEPFESLDDDDFDDVPLTPRKADSPKTQSEPTVKSPTNKFLKESPNKLTRSSSY